MTTGGTDNSTLDAISLLYNGLINGVKTYGAVDPDGNPYIVRLDWFQKDYQSKNINTIVVIPKDSTFELPIDNNEKTYGTQILYTELQNYEIHLWARNYDEIYHLKSFVMTIAKQIFKGWMIFERFENSLEDENCQGKFGILYCTTKALIPTYIAPYGYTKIIDEDGNPDTNPLKEYDIPNTTPNPLGFIQ